MSNQLNKILLLSFCGLLAGSALQAQPRSRAEFEQHHQQEIAAKSRAWLQLQKTQDLATPSPSQLDFDVTYYGLNLKINPTSQQVSGFVEVHARSLVAALATVQLDLYSGLTVDSVRGDATNFTRTGNSVTLTLKNSVPREAALQARVYYHGRPQGGGFGGFVFDTQGGQPLIWTLSEPYYARSWWPCKDTPSDKADSVDLVITVPSALTAVSNGALRLKQDNGNGTTTFHWHEGYPITTYLVSLAITNYTTITQWFRYSPTDSMEVRHYVYPSSLQQARNGLRDMVDMIRFFHETFAPYPFLKEKYGVAQFGWGGGMEHQTITSQGGFSSSLNVHELAHQWWGDMITNATWSDIWLNEGFASYSEALYFEHAVSRAYYHEYMSYMSNEYSGSIYRRDTTSVSSIFNSIVYDKGAWVLHMLRHVVGEDNFFAILRKYANDLRFKYGNASTAGFQRVCEEVYGRDLTWFFEPWIYGTSRPFYKYSWSVKDSAATSQLKLKIDQAQALSHQLFAMPIDVFIAMPNADTTLTVFVDQAAQSFSFALPQRPTAVKLDPENWILKYVQETATGVDEPGSGGNDYALLQNYPNPFNGETRIAFFLPEPARVEIKIFDLTGAVVRRWAAQAYDAGRHFVSWDGANDRGEALGSGIYFYQMQAGKSQESRRLVYLK